MAARATTGQEAREREPRRRRRCDDDDDDDDVDDGKRIDGAEVEGLAAERPLAEQAPCLLERAAAADIVQREGD